MGPASINMINSALEANQLTAEVVIFDINTSSPPDTQCILFSELMDKNQKENEVDTFTPEPVEDIFDTAVIFFSSGTTGLPKAIMSPHYGLLYNNNFFGLVLLLSCIILKIY